MEDSPAGKKTSGNTFVESPKKVIHGTTNSSQWSFGWNGNAKDVYNRPNNSKGNASITQDSIFTTTRAVSYWASKRVAAGRRSNPWRQLTWKRKIQWETVLCGTTTLRTRVRRRWCWVLRRRTIVRRTRFIRRGLQQRWLRAVRNDSGPIYWANQVY